MNSIKVLLFFILCFAIFGLIHFTIEAFQCHGTYTVSKCGLSQENHDVNTEKKIATGEFTSLVGENTVCQTSNMSHEMSHLIPNGYIQVGERVYVLYKNQYYPARIARVYKKNDESVVKQSATSYSSYSPSNTPSFLTRPNPLFHSSHPLHYDEHLYQQWTSQQPSLNMKTSNVKKTLLTVHTDGDWVDVVFQDNTLNTERLHSSMQDLRFNVQRDIIRLPQPELIDQCAKACLSQFSNTWGIETGSCLEKTCKCTCVVPQGTASTCDNIQSMDDVESQNAIRAQTQTDLHKIDNRVRMQHDMYNRISKPCPTSGQQLPVSFKCINQNTGGATATTTTTNNTPCCPHRCDAYTGQEKEMCLNPDKLQNFLNNMPQIYSMGKGMCFEDNVDKETSTCPKKTDIPCPKRLRKNCKTIQESDYYKCEYHTHDIHNKYDEYATGCYEKSKCMFHKDTASCEQDKNCMWRKDAHYCDDKKHCPSECVKTSSQNKDSCTGNPFCRWTGTKCLQQNVIDTDEFKSIMKAPASSTSSILKSYFPDVNTQALQSTPIEYSTSNVPDVNLPIISAGIFNNTQ